MRKNHTGKCGSSLTLLFDCFRFSDGTVFREVDVVTGKLKIGTHIGPLKTGKVFAGGNCESFRRLMRARGKDVLYVGDHIFGDVLRSKKSRGELFVILIDYCLQDGERFLLCPSWNTNFESGLSTTHYLIKSLNSTFDWQSSTRTKA